MNASFHLDGLSTDADWKILVVAADDDVHDTAQLALKDFVFNNKSVQILGTSSIAKGRIILKDHPDIAVVLLEVGLKAKNNGLALVKFIRQTLANPFMRIILQTGDSADVLTREAIVADDIDGCVAKTEVNADKLFSLVIPCLRAYQTLITVENQRQELDQKVQERTAELASLEEQFRTVANFTYDWEYWVDPAGKHVYVSPSCERITGHRAEEFIGNPDLLKTLVHPDDRSSVVSHHQAAQETGEIHPLDFRIITRSGAERWISHVCQPVFSEDGRYLGQRGSNRDITEQVRMQEALKDNEQLFRKIINTVPALILVKDFDGNIIMANNRMTEFYDTTPGEIVGRNELELVDLYGASEEDVKTYLSAGQEVIKTQQPKFIPQVSFTHPDGTCRYYQTTNVPLNIKGNPKNLLMVAEDITARVRSDEERTRLATVIEQATVTVVITDLQGSIVYANPAFENSTGYSVAEAIGQNPNVLNSGLQEQAFYQELWDTIAAGQTWNGIFINKRKNGTLFHEEATIFPIKNASGEISNYAAVKRDINARVQAEEALAEKSMYLENILRSATEYAITTTDLDYRVTYYNPLAEIFFGYTTEEVTGKTVQETHTMEQVSAERFEKAIEHVHVHGEYCYRVVQDIDDGTRYLDSRVSGIFDSDGELVGYALFSHNVTEQVNVEKALRESESKYRLLVENQSDLVVQVDLEGRFQFVSLSYCELFGKTEEELRGKPFMPLVHPDDQGSTAKAMHDLYQPPHAVYFEQRAKTRAGWRWLGWMDTAVLDQNGNVTSITGVGRDITERVLAEQALQEERDFASSLVDTAQAIILVLDMEGKIVRFNPYMETLSGYSLAEVQGQDWFNTFLPERDRTRTRVLLQESMQSMQTSTDSNTIVTRNGSERQIEWYNKTLNDGAGNISGLLSVGHDITERIQAEDERKLLLAQIHAQAKQMQQTLDTVPEGVLLLDMDQRVILANPVAREYLAILADAKVGHTLTHLGGRPIEELFTSPATKGLWHELTSADRTFEVITRPIENGPQPENWVLVINEVTKEREVQQFVQQQDRLAAVGQLAAGIAHDFNNIMSVILLYTEMSLSLPDIPVQLRERLETVNQQAYKATDLIQQILDFGRQSVLDRHPMDLKPFLIEQVKLLERTLPESITVALDYGKDDFTVVADPTRMQQVVMNLAINARDAMLPAGSGDLRISLSRLRETDEIQCLTCGPISGTEMVCITVTDTGEGIPPDVLSHIFEPFFTTKTVGRGTGLGLSQVYGIVKQHDGHIAINTKTGTGTTFKIYLPALLVHRSKTPSIEKPAAILGHGETILVVEDDAALRQALVDRMELLNYRVLETANGQAALEALEQHAVEIALVLSDMVMPVMGGQALFHEIKQRGLPQPVVILSGHPMEEELTGLTAQGLAGWMIKPPNMEQLSRLLAEVLQG